MVKAYFIACDSKDCEIIINGRVSISELFDDYGQDNADELFQGFETELTRDSSLFVQQYLYFQNKPLSIAFCADNGETVKIKNEDSYVELPSYESDNGTYLIFDKPTAKGNFPFTNIKTVGTLMFQIEADNNFDITLTINPSISEDDYNLILNDLKAIYIRLIYQNKGISMGMDRGNDTEYLILNSKVEAITQIVNSLSEDPQSDLINVPAKLKWNDVKKIDSRAIMDHYVLKKSKVRGSIHKKSFDIFENAQILRYLYSLLNEIKLLKDAYIRREKEEDNSVDGYKSNENPITGFVELEKKLNKAIKGKMFEHIKPSTEDLKITNLFINHPKYSKAFDIIGRYNNENLLPLDKISYSPMRSSCAIYELWTYFSILDIIVNDCKYNPSKYLDISSGEFVEISKTNNFSTVLKSIIIKIVEYLKANGKSSLQGLVFYLKKGDTELFWAYNYTIHYDIDGANQKKNPPSLRPDNLLIKKTPDECIMYTLDAKYQNYKANAQGLEEWYKQMVECAAEKYLYKIYNLYNMKRRDLIVFSDLFGEDKLNNDQKLKLYGSVLLHPGIVDINCKGLTNPTLLKGEENINDTFDAYINGDETKREAVKPIRETVNRLTKEKNNDGKNNSVWGSFIFTPTRKKTIRDFFKEILG